MNSKRIAIRYVCVIHLDDNILVSHQTEPDDYEACVHAVLMSHSFSREADKKFTFPFEFYQIHLLTDEDDLLYACVTAKTEKLHIPFAFLDRVKARFKEILSIVQRSSSKNEDNYQKDFQVVLAEIMYDFNIGNGGVISALQSQVDDVKKIMLDNIQKIIERGEHLDELLAKTEDLEANGGEFRQRTRNISRQMKCKNLKMWLIIGTFLGCVLAFAVLLATGVVHL